MRVVQHFGLRALPDAMATLANGFDWDNWLNSQPDGARVPKTGTVHSLYSVALEEARHGGGVLMAHEVLVQNLLDNALKFTPNGGNVRIALQDLGNSVEIRIVDTGPGIPEAQQRFIFERYRQTKSGQQKEGAGLGLAIVKKILELHNASIQVFSKPNEGTAFSFSLPLYQVA